MLHSKIRVWLMLVASAWFNSHIGVRMMHIMDLATELDDGIKLITLMEVITNAEKPLGKYKQEPKMRIQVCA